MELISVWISGRTARFGVVARMILGYDGAESVPKWRTFRGGGGCRHL